MSKNIFQIRRLEKFTLGDYLKNRRRESRNTLEEMAEKTAISQEYLEALEKNDLDQLPPEVYARGFVSRYAKALKLDPDKAIFLYEKSRSKRKITALPKIGLPFLKLQMFFNYRNIIYTSTFLLVLVLVIYLVKVVYPIYQKPYFGLSSPSRCPYETESAIMEISGTVQAESELWINQEKTVVNKEGNFSCLLYLKEGKNIIKFRVINKFGRERNEECVVRKIES
ncbi:MAG: hypothetical protein FJZ04_02425 [Candidatus Moranbacteria bacterium]|nr:hypothetical protein [Candidatus Moranbacteria bacterium]